MLLFFCISSLTKTTSLYILASTMEKLPVIGTPFLPILLMEVVIMTNQNPIEYTGKVLDQRNDLTGPDDSDKASYPKRPKHVSIQKPKRK